MKKRMDLSDNLVSITWMVMDFNGTNETDTFDRFINEIFG